MTGPSRGFDAQAPGTPADRWRTDDRLTAAPRLDPGGVRTLIVVAAHPDDETLGAGGLIARCAAAGAAVTVVCATAGQASHPGSRTTPPAVLAELRRAEVRSAVGILAPGAVLDLLDLPDGQVRAHVGELAAAVRSHLPASATPDDCWVVAPWHGDRHPDHTAAAEAAADAAGAGGCRVLEYPIWAWHWADPDAGDGPDALPTASLRRLPLPDDARDRKAAATAHYTSQITPLSSLVGDEAVLSPGFLEHFAADAEYFVDPAEGRASTAPRVSLSGTYFDRQYAESGTDPWGFEDRWYEERKRAITLAALPRRRFAAAFEPGCSIGVLTAELADRCDTLLSTDVAAAALEVARTRLLHRPHVRFARGGIPELWPDGPWDLIVLSEVGYYCGDLELGVVIERIRRTLRPDGVLLACHWRHPVTDYPLRGDEVHERLRAETGLTVLVEHLEDDFRLDVLAGPQVRSVGRAEGLAP